MSIKICATAGAVKFLPKEVIGESLDNLIDDTDDMGSYKGRGVCPAEVVNLEGYPEFFITYNPREESAFVCLTSEEEEICPDGILNMGVGKIRIRDILAAENN